VAVINHMKYGAQQQCPECSGFNPSGFALPEECVWCRGVSHKDLMNRINNQVGTPPNIIEDRVDVNFIIRCFNWIFGGR